MNRGPESHLASGLLRQSWFYSVRGNYEDLIVQTYSSGHREIGGERKVGKWLLVMKPLVLGNFLVIDTGAAFAGSDPRGFSPGALTLLDVSVPIEEIAGCSFTNAIAEDVLSVA